MSRQKHGLFGSLVCSILVLSTLSWVSSASAATRNILVTGFWPPTNAMVQEFSQDPTLNPAGWQGKNWQNSGYDLYSYFPTFPNGGEVGTGDFPVDFASVYNDFMKYTQLLNPIAIVSFGQDAGSSWIVEQNFPNYFLSMFQGTIPSQIGVVPAYPVPDSLKTNQTFHSTLPLQKIADAVNALGISATVDTGGDAGDFLCGFTGYLGSWYHSQHSDPKDPAYNEMAGFIHTDLSVENGVKAAEASLKQVVLSLKQP